MGEWYGTLGANTTSAPCRGAEPHRSHPSPAWATQMLGRGRPPRVHPQEVLTPLLSAALRGHSAVCAGHPSPQLSTCHKMTSAPRFFWKFQGWLRSPVRHQTSHGPGAGLRCGQASVCTWPGPGGELLPILAALGGDVLGLRPAGGGGRQLPGGRPSSHALTLQEMSSSLKRLGLQTVQPQLGPGSLPGFTCRSLCLPLPPLPRGGVHLAAQAGTDLRGESAVSPVLRKAPGPRQGAFLWSDPACCRLPHGTSLGPVSQPPGAEVPFSL